MVELRCQECGSPVPRGHCVTDCDNCSAFLDDEILVAIGLNPRAQPKPQPVALDKVATEAPTIEASPILVEQPFVDIVEEPSNVEQATPPTGMVECEFCKGKVKPDVTYCKHCGIKLRG